MHITVCAYTMCHYLALTEEPVGDGCVSPVLCISCIVDVFHQLSMEVAMQYAPTRPTFLPPTHPQPCLSSKLPPPAILTHLHPNTVLAALACPQAQPSHTWNAPLFATGHTYRKTSL
jgi:hypothetical protein